MQLTSLKNLLLQRNMQEWKGDIFITCNYSMFYLYLGLSRFIIANWFSKDDSSKLTKFEKVAQNVVGFGNALVTLHFIRSYNFTSSLASFLQGVK